MDRLRRFHIDERYVTVNLTLSIILYSMVVPFCIYLSVDNFIRNKPLVAYYALFCAIMTAIATICFAICKFGKKRRRWLMHLALNIQCFVYWITFFFFLYTGGTEGSSIFLFFLAVLLVIVGTYCLFTAGSIALLKALRKNKKYYFTFWLPEERVTELPSELVRQASALAGKFLRGVINKED